MDKLTDEGLEIISETDSHIPNKAARQKGKFEQAIEIIGSMPNEDRNSVVGIIMDKLKTNRKNASTYYGRWLKDIKPSNSSERKEEEEESIDKGDQINSN